jgi:hypothetical protein
MLTCRVYMARLAAYLRLPQAETGVHTRPFGVLGRAKM